MKSVAPIGAGGMGEVYKARDPRLNRTVAIKVLPLHIAERPDLKQRFEREAQTIASLNHPHICVVYDVGQHEGTDFLVMEFLEGETLADRLSKGPLPYDQLITYAHQIVNALDKAHRHGVTHRDLKPGNIMLTKTGVKLLDFGLAKVQQIGGPVSQSVVPTIATGAAATHDGRHHSGNCSSTWRPNNSKERKRTRVPTSLPSVRCSTRWPPVAGHLKESVRSA